MPIRVCPECGRVFSDAELNQCTRRLEAQSALPVASRRLFVNGAKLVAVAFVIVLAISLDLYSAVVALIFSAAVIAGTWRLGCAAARTSGKHNRAAVQVAWAGAVPWLSAPWLLALPVLLGIFTTYMLVRVLPVEANDTPVLPGLLLLVAFAYFVCAIKCMVKGSELFNECCDRYGARDGAWRGLMTVLILSTSFLSMILALLIVLAGIGALDRAGWLQD